MVPNEEFLKQPKSFWAQVKLISMTLKYSKGGTIKEYNIEEIEKCLNDLGLTTEHLVDSAKKITAEGKLLLGYFHFRAEVLKRIVKPNLMDKDQAKEEFEKLKKSYSSKVNIPLNKQKGKKRHPAYLTGLVDMLTEKTLGSLDFDPNPRELTVVTKNQKPLRTLSRWVDGAYPSTTNPLAIWEVKEYYSTTSFGSRVADGVYESLLDGYELEELRLKEFIEVKHYLIVDGYLTWWDMGKSYLCRLVDMLHEGFLDEVIFGKEILDRWPEIVKSWPKSSTKSTVVGRERLLRS